MSGPRKPPNRPGDSARKPQQLSRTELKELIAVAIIDAYGDDEQRLGLFTMIEDNLQLPFETLVLGVPVVVESVELEESDIFATCVRGREKQAVPILKLPLPTPPPKGSEWIAAYSYWARGV